MQPDTILIDLQYLPCLAYFSRLLGYERIELITYEPYQKQSYSNRCYILGSQQVDRLTVPVLEGKKQNIYSAIQIDHQQKWSKIHWRSISTNYGKAPYFEYMAAYFQAILFANYTYLYELSLALLQLCLELLQLKKTVTMHKYSTSAVPEGCNAVHSIHPRKNLTTSMIYRPIAYQQVFGTEFIDNLSIIDLLFCKGPEAITILEASVIRNEQSKTGI